MAFAFATLVVYFSGWSTIGTLMIAMIVGYILMALSRVFHANPNQPVIDWRSGQWIIPYLVGLSLLSYFGQYTGPSAEGQLLGGIGIFKHNLIGGTGKYLPLWWDILVVAVFALAIYFWAIVTRLPEEKVDEYVREVFPPVAAGH